MQTFVIVVLLLAGVLCIVAQIAITYVNSRPAQAPAAPAKPARSSAAKKSTAATASAKTAAAKAAKAEADAKEAAAAEAAKTEAAESTMERLMRHTTAALGSKNASDAKLGMLGLALMLIAVALVIDITVSFTVST